MRLLDGKTGLDDPLDRIVDEIVPYYMTHNGEVDACDLLIDVEQLEKVVSFCDESNFSKVGSYIVTAAAYVPEGEEAPLLRVCATSIHTYIYLPLQEQCVCACVLFTHYWFLRLIKWTQAALELYKGVQRFDEALNVSFSLGQSDIQDVFNSCHDPYASPPSSNTLNGIQTNKFLTVNQQSILLVALLCPVRIMRKQMALICGDHHIVLETDDDDLRDLTYRSSLSSRFVQVAGDLDSLEPKKPEDVFKSHLIDSRMSVRDDFSLCVPSLFPTLSHTLTPIMSSCHHVIMPL
jgi:26S proteasome regulatory subunit N1